MTNSEIELLRDLGLDKIKIKSIRPAKKRSQYQAIINWLISPINNNYNSSAKIKNIDLSEKYIEIIHHLCKLKSWEMLQTLIHKPTFGVLNTPLPIYEYLLFNQLSRKLFNISEDIINSFSGLDFDLSFILVLKARALSDSSETLEEARELFQKIFSQSKEGTEIYYESLVYLGIRQVNSGLYQEGVANLEKALNQMEIHTFLRDIPNIKELETHIIENLAFYEMNATNFDRANFLFGQTVKLREDLGLLYKIPAPLAHQGIIMRKLGNYEEAFRLLDKAKSTSKLFDSESSITWINHHLAFVLLNQGKLIQAENLALIALEGNLKEENLWRTGDSYEQLGLIYLALEKIEMAEENFVKSLVIRQRIGNKHGIASSTIDLALLAWNKKDIWKALTGLVYGFYLYYQLRILNLNRFRRMLKLSLIWTIGKKKWTM